MKCKVCGKEVPEYFRVCDACGAEMTPPVTQPLATEQPTTTPSAADLYDPISQKFSVKFGRAAFLVAAILFAIYSAISTFILGTLPVLQVIATVAMFMLYSKARANADTYEYRSPLKMMSGVALAEYIIGWVLVGLCVVVGGLVALAGSLIDSIDPSEIGDFSELEAIGIDMENIDIFLVVFGVIFVVIAIVYIFINVFCIGRMRKCAKSFADSCESGVWFIEKLGAVRGWLITLGVFNILSALIDLGSISTLAFDTGVLGVLGIADTTAATEISTYIFSAIASAVLAVAFFLLASCAKDEEIL